MNRAGQTLSLTHTRQADLADLDQWCYAPGECVATDPLVPFALVLLTGVVTFLVAATLLHLEQARPLIEEERDRTRAERDAFAEFSRRIASIDATASQSSVVANDAVATLTHPPMTGRLDRVKDVYRETVMAVPHYEEEYDESLETNMSAELGEGIATAVEDESELTPHLQAALVASSDDARRKREEFLRRLELEETDLADVESRLSEIDAELDELEDLATAERDFGALLAAWNRLDDLESRCRSILADRQDFLHDRRAGPRDAASLQEYLYRPLDVDYPVLSSGTSLAERIDAARRDLESAFAGR